MYEIVDNAVDEALAGYCDTIDVTINQDNSITVIDNGRGVPVGYQSQNRETGSRGCVYNVLHAGGKFGGGGYKVSGGLHGVGASVVNALSVWLEVSKSAAAAKFTCSVMSGAKYVKPLEVDRRMRYGKDRNKSNISYRTERYLRKHVYEL